MLQERIAAPRLSNGKAPAMKDRVPGPGAATAADDDAAHESRLERAQRAVDSLARTRRDRWYPHFHIASNGGWMNDPNGLCRYRGRWHVFYQLHPFGTQWGPMHWGHVSSADMVTWRREPVALAPSMPQDASGVFSGCAAESPDGHLMLYYTGTRKKTLDGSGRHEREVQMLARSRNADASAFRKLGMIVDCPSEGMEGAFRDPKVWRQGGRWLLVVGVGSESGRGQIWLYSSPDMVHWRFDRVLYEHPDVDVFMLECPDFFPLADADGNEEWVLSFSAMGSKARGYTNRNANSAGYVTGTWADGEGFTPRSAFRPWDWGHNYYAPQSFEAPDGRRIMYGWMSPFAHRMPMDRDGWCGQLTLPREVVLGRDGRIRTCPVAETERLRCVRRDIGPVRLGPNEERTVCDDAWAVEIVMEVNLRETTAERAGLKIHHTCDGSYTYIAYDDQTRRIVVDRQAAARGDRGYRAAPLSESDLESGTLRLRIFIDRGSVEVYANAGEQVLSSYSFASPGRRRVTLTSESGVSSIGSLSIYDMRGIGLD